MNDAADFPASTYRRAITILLAVLSIVLTTASLGTFGVFLLVSGFDLIRLDAGQPARMLFNGLLSLVFFVQHSGMVRPSFRRWLAGWAGRSSVAGVYALVSSVALLAVVLLWQGPLETLWSAAGAVRWAIRSLFGLGTLLMGWGWLAMLPDDRAGWRSLWRGDVGQAGAELRPVESGPYRWVRHPQYLAALLMIWSAPDLTVDRIGFNVVWSGWVLIAMRLEERDLVERHGEQYRGYQRRVPMFLPWPGRYGG